MSIATPTFTPTGLPQPPAEHRDQVAAQLRDLMATEVLDALVAFGPRNHYYLSGMLHPLLYDGVPTGCASAVLFANPADGRGAVEMEFIAPGHVSTDDLDLRTYPTWTFIDNPYRLRGVSVNSELTTTASLDKSLTTLASIFRDRVGISRVGVDLQQMHAVAWMRLAELLPHIEFVDASHVFAASQARKSPWEIKQVIEAHDISEAAMLQAASTIQVGSTVRDLHREFVQAVWSRREASAIRFAFISVGVNFSPSTQTHRTIGAQPGDVIKFDLGAEVNGYGADIARNFVLGTPSSLAAETHDALRDAHRVLVAGAVPGRPLSDLFTETMAVAQRTLPQYRRGHLGHSTGLEVEMHPHVSASDPHVLSPGMVFSLELPYYGHGLGAFNIEDMVVVSDTKTDNLTKASKELERR
jgi:Xaa-Pro aminopeptidase